MITYLILALAGALSWSFSEYMLHRFLAHACKGRNTFSREHLAHHSNPAYFTPTSKKVLVAVFWFVTVFGLTRLLWSQSEAAFFTAGFVGFYTFYEVLHRRIHTAAPRGAYGRMVRKHHLSHHFTDARLRHGVTSRFWDRVFRTHEPIAQVRVPRKLATPWMLNQRGELQDSYADSYLLVGRPRD